MIRNGWHSLNLNIGEEQYQILREIADTKQTTVAQILRANILDICEKWEKQKR